MNDILKYSKCSYKTLYCTCFILYRLIMIKQLGTGVLYRERPLLPFQKKKSSKLVCKIKKYCVNLFFSKLCLSFFFTASLNPGDDFLPSSPLFGKPLTEQHVYLPFYEGNKMQSRKLKNHRKCCSSTVYYIDCTLVL